MHQKMRCLKLAILFNECMSEFNYTASPEEAEFVGLTAVVGTIQLYR